MIHKELKVVVLLKGCANAVGQTGCCDKELSYVPCSVTTTLLGKWADSILSQFIPPYTSGFIILHNIALLK